ncbi:hypothetical protein [Cohnella lupini]|uniref:Uncharacterized protein n=1 Tax=Cohnella lupini TaxID=1294267 RepID=A0A3D9I7N0_9BACL|nr:hypothetical protein [Cohnella lupini]RED57176.1 hypothetical protein DFP95_11190 [Cohnella lupini]
MKVSQEDGFTYVTYHDDKRPLKLVPFFIDGIDREIIFSRILKFIECKSNAPAHLARMEPEKWWSLVERLSTLVCREFSPTANWGVTKPEIRGVVYFVMNEGVRAGAWPETYMMTQTTFVQYCEVGCDYGISG